MGRYADTWKNAKKSKVMVVGKTNSSEKLSVCGEEMEKVKAFKYLHGCVD